MSAEPTSVSTTGRSRSQRPAGASRIPCETGAPRAASRPRSPGARRCQQPSSSWSATICRRTRRSVTCPTMNEGFWLSRWLVFARAVRHAVARTGHRCEPTVVHIHFASRGSTLRKMLLAQLVVHARRPLILHAHGGGFDKFHRGLPALLRRMVNRTLQQAQRVHRVVQPVARFLHPRVRARAFAGGGVAESGEGCPRACRNAPAAPEVQFVHLGEAGRSKGSTISSTPSPLCLPQLRDEPGWCWPAMVTSTNCASSPQRGRATACVSLSWIEPHRTRSPAGRERCVRAAVLWRRRADVAARSHGRGTAFHHHACRRHTRCLHAWRGRALGSAR